MALCLSKILQLQQLPISQFTFPFLRVHAGFELALPKSPMRVRTAHAEKEGADALIGSFVVWVILFLQGLVFLSSGVLSAKISGTLGKIAWLFLSIILLLPAYFKISRQARRRDVARTRLSFLSWILSLEMFLVVGIHVNAEYLPGMLEARTLAGNFGVFLACVLLKLALDRLIRNMSLKPSSIVWRVATAYMIAGAACSAAIGLAAGWQVSPHAVAESRHTAGGDRPNVILISIDTLRADHLGCYGSDRGLSPRLDQFAKQSTLFKSPISNSPWTLPSHASLFTSLYPSGHGAIRPGNRVPKSLVTLAELLREESYATAAFTGGGWLSPWHGLGQGFEIFNEYADERLKLKPIVVLLDLWPFKWKPCFSYGIQRAKKWIRANYAQGKKFFLFVHTYEVHNYYYNMPKLDPYLERLGFEYDGRVNYATVEMANSRDTEMEYFHGLYEAEIAFTDALLGELFSELDLLGLDTNTLIVVTSDHGEGFNRELKRLGHGGRLHMDQLFVPLLFRLPGAIQSGVTVNEVVQLIDIAPTILDLVGVPVPKDFQGKPLAGLLRGEEEDTDRHVYSEEFAYRIDEGGIRREAEASFRMVSMTSGEHELICSSDGNEFYDIRQDPGETNNLAAAEPAVMHTMNREIAGFVHDNPPPVVTGEKGMRLPNHLIKQLKALDYLR